MTAPQPASTSTTGDALRVARSREVVTSCTDYADARRAVDRLDERAFPVEQVTIVGEDLRVVEPSAALTAPRAALAGAGLGALFGAVLGFVLGLFTAAPLVSGLALALYGLLFGAGLGAVLGAVGRALLGRQDVPAVVAARYDVVCPAEQAGRAAELLSDRR